MLAQRPLCIQQRCVAHTVLNAQSGYHKPVADVSSRMQTSSSHPPAFFFFCLKASLLEVNVSACLLTELQRLDVSPVPSNLSYMDVSRWAKKMRKTRAEHVWSRKFAVHVLIMMVEVLCLVGEYIKPVVFDVGLPKNDYFNSRWKADYYFDVNWIYKTHH